VDTRAWFDDDELDVCPFCGEKAVPRTGETVAVCLACEVAWTMDGEPHALGGGSTA
jgi:ribosomal protein L37AE/L43A